MKHARSRPPPQHQLGALCWVALGSPVSGKQAARSQSSASSPAPDPSREGPGTLRARIPVLWLPHAPADYADMGEAPATQTQTVLQPLDLNLPSASDPNLGRFKTL